MTELSFAYVDNTNVIELTDTKNAIDDSYINDATVTATVKVAGGDAVGGVTWPITMTYVDGSDGTYRAILVDGLELVDRKHYVAVIDLDGGEDLVAHWEFPFRASTRTTE